jgi:hypothetical protein
MISGTCLCGEVAWQFDGTVELINFCHCSMCRKVHGAPYGAFAHGNASEFRWLRGATSISRYQSSPNIFRCFCQVCGSSVPVLEGTEVCIPAGGIDGDPGVRPSVHIFVGSKAPGMKSLTPFHSLMAFRLMSIGKQRCVVGPNHAFNRTRRYGPSTRRAPVAAGRLTWSC